MDDTIGRSPSTDYFSIGDQLTAGRDITGVGAFA